MRDPAPAATRLKDYAPPAFRIETVDLQVEIFEDHALVRSRLAVSRRPGAPPSPLVLDGEELELESVALDGRALSSSEYALDEEHLTIAQVPERCTLEILCRIRPRRNTKLMGLYAAESGFFTQCEAEGFRRITYFLDRPDVMAKYTVTIHADREKYPVLLSNGNPVASGTEADGRRWLRWHDPFPKPCYLFAMVAAKLEKLEDSFVTRSGRRVQLAIYVDPGKLDQCGFAMQALKRAMKWDEETFGLEVDLGHYSIVAVGDFNAGAMENKGLNLFNTRYVLARPDTATPAATGSSFPSRRGSPCSASRNSARTCTRVRWSASAKCGTCAPRSSPRTPGRWRIRCGPAPTWRSATSTPPPSTKRAPRWCA